MKVSKFLEGVEEKYPAKLLEGRVQIEGNVIGAVWADPSIIQDYNLSGKDFLTTDGRFLFEVAKTLRNEFKLNELDETSVVTYLPEDLYNKFKAIGGYESIRNIVDVISRKNTNSYVDNLNKSNLFIKMYKSGIDATHEIDDGNGKMVCPIEFCKNFDCQGVSDWYDSLLVKIGKDESCTSKVIEEKFSMDITPELISSFKSGDMVGTPIDYFDEEDIDERGKKIRVFPFLQREICGFRHGTTNALCGYSSTGKSMLMCEYVLALVSHGEKVLILSNEMNSTPYYLNFISFLAFRKFRYSRLTRDKLQQGTLGPEEEIYLDKVTKYFNENFAKNIVFCQITDADIQLAKRKIKNAVLEHGCSVVVYDTMKADISDFNEKQPTYMTLIRDSRELDSLAKKYNLICLVSIQISSATKGRCWIDESCISQSKQLIEIMETCLMLRNVYGDSERKPGEKNYIKPFLRKQREDGSWYTEDMELDPNAYYSLLFITKNRAGKNSEKTNAVILLKADTHIATFHEEAWARPTRGFVGFGNQ